MSLFLVCQNFLFTPENLVALPFYFLWVVSVRISQGHEGSFEVMYFLSGTGVCTDDGETVEVRPGMTHYCAPGHSHSVVNTGAEPLVILGVVPNVK